jgi:hypothetical protein
MHAATLSGRQTDPVELPKFATRVLEGETTNVRDDGDESFNDTTAWPSLRFRERNTVR